MFLRYVLSTTTVPRMSSSHALTRQSCQRTLNRVELIHSASSNRCSPRPSARTNWHDRERSHEHEQQFIPRGDPHVFYLAHARATTARRVLVTIAFANGRLSETVDREQV
jgi:hypothetical protein